MTGSQQGLTLRDIFAPETDRLPGPNPMQKPDARGIPGKWLDLLHWDNRVRTPRQRGTRRHDDRLPAFQHRIEGTTWKPSTGHTKHRSEFPGIRGPDGKTIEPDRIHERIRDPGEGWNRQEPADTVTQSHFLIGKDPCRAKETIQNLL